MAVDKRLVFALVVVLALSVFVYAAVSSPPAGSSVEKWFAFLNARLVDQAGGSSNVPAGGTTPGTSAVDGVSNIQKKGCSIFDVTVEQDGSEKVYSVTFSLHGGTDCSFDVGCGDETYRFEYAGSNLGYSPAFNGYKVVDNIAYVMDCGRPGFNYFQTRSSGEGTCAISGEGNKISIIHKGYADGYKDGTSIETYKFRIKALTPNVECP
jgi:hypothetical protein